MLTISLVEHLSMAQGGEFLQAHPQLGAPGFVNMGMLQPQQHVPNFAIQGQVQNIPQQNFSFPQGKIPSNLLF